MSRNNQAILVDLCHFDATEKSSTFRLPHDCYMIFLARLKSREHFDKLTNAVDEQNDSHDKAAGNAKFTMMETEEMEYFLEFVTMDNSATIEELNNDRNHRFVYEDHFNPALLDMMQKKATFARLKHVCRFYETKKDISIDKIMAEHEKRTTLSTPYFLKAGLTKDDAQGAALALSFYTGTKSEALNRSASLVARQANGEVIEEKTKEEMNEAAIILYYLVKALSYIPFYWGYVTRACQLTDDELKMYVPGSLITWIQFSSSKKGTKAATNFNFAGRNTFSKIYSLTGRPIKQFSNYQEEDEVLFLPHSTFFVFKHEVGFHGTQHTIYMRQIELGLSRWSVLWVDDRIYKEDWENKRHMETAATRAMNLNVHFIPKHRPESALAFLRSPFGQRLRNKDTFRIVTDMNRENEKPVFNAGARLVKAVRRMGFKNDCMVFTSDRKKAEQIIKSELSSAENYLITVSEKTEDLRSFVNFEQVFGDVQQSTYSSKSKIFICIREHKIRRDNKKLLIIKHRYSLY